ncbi:GNAT family N-acetyltransferase [bacterium]|nr:GNAT family N-acetyltransferase [bacterium]
MEHKSNVNPEDFQLRPLLRNELKRFIELGFPTCSFLHGREGIDKDFQKQQFTNFVCEHAFEEGSEVHVLTEPSGQIIAQLWLHTAHNHFNGQRELWIWDITVDEAYRGNGLSQRLLEFAQKRTEELYCQELWLLVAENNVRARRIYEHFGLADAGRVMKLSMNDREKQTSDTIEIDIPLPDGLTLRLIKESELAAMLELWQDAELDHRPKGRDTLENLRAERRHIPDLFWGVFDKQRIVGSIIGTSDGRRGWINRLAVHPDYRRKSIAQALVAVCEKALRARGIRIIAGLVMEDNNASIKMLESCGYLLYHGVLYYSKRESEDV